MAFTLLAAACSDDDDPVTQTDAADDDMADEDMADEDMADDDMADDDMADDDMADDDMADDDMADDDMSDDMADTEHTFRVTLTNTSGDFAIAASGAQAIPVDGTEAGPALPGSGYEFVVPRSAANLSFATMFVQTNDWFWSPGPDGLALVDADGNAVSGDVTDQVSLWDAGTEIDQTPGEGADQAPRQAGPNTGDVDPDSTVRAVDGFDAANYISVNLTPNDDGSTTVRIDNVSENASVPGPIAPVAWAVHGPEATFFTPGEAAPAGFEELAEDGGPGGVVEGLAPLTGTPTPFAPIAWVVGDGSGLLFERGGTASAGLEELAEDGGPGTLVDEVIAAGYDNAGAATNPDDGAEAGPAFPGSTYTFEFTANDGDYLHLASMLVQSNDWFVSLVDVPLYGDDGRPIDGDLTDQLRLYDAGTEIDQALGAGPDQAPRQAGPDTGAVDENDEIRGLEFDLDGYLTVTIELS
ncbi:MAG: spondin domain-containing protein [Actinomycetota bacterium]